MSEKTSIHWFRQDLRLSDNPALTEAAKHKKTLLIYILDDENSQEHAMGEASRWWLHHSLNKLYDSLEGALSVYKGNPQTIIDNLCKHYDVESIYWNRCYEPWRISRDTKIKAHLEKQSIAVKTFNGSLLWEPWNIKKEDGTPYKVFTPFYRKGCLNYQQPRIPLPKPAHITSLLDSNQIGINNLALLPKKNWDKKLEPYWTIGESHAKKRFEAFCQKGLSLYKEGRNIPAKPYVSRLSPHLHFGELSPNQLWHTLRGMCKNKHIDHFCSELGWREFSYNLLYYNPDLPYKNLQSKFDDFPWADNTKYLKAWQLGKTGIPMVDAGMRELWQTGYMHNRVRMIVGSFLVKNLRLHWHHGERWFWNTLVDADLANNSASWQWVSGCGADAAPYFRIFNPVTQGQKFDTEGEYIRMYIPELSSLPNQYIFCPWLAPELVLKEANIKLGSTYPYPIVDLTQSRQEALTAFESLK